MIEKSCDLALDEPNSPPSETRAKAEQKRHLRWGMLYFESQAPIDENNFSKWWGCLL